MNEETARKVTLVFPRFVYRNMGMPLGFLWVAGVLEKAGYALEFLDGTLLSEAQVIQRIKDSAPLFVFFSLQSVFADKTFPLIREIKKALPKTKIIIGGPHPTLLPTDTLKEEGIDIVVTQEAEQTVSELMNVLVAGKSLHEVKGIGFKDEEGKVILTPPRALLQNLDELPLPARHLLDEKYFREGICSFMATRGCPWTCAFCQPTLDKLFGEKFRMRSPENMVQELLETKELFAQKGHALKEAHFTDDGLTYNHIWLKKFCELLIEKKVNVKWTANTRCDTMPKGELAVLMKKAGCILVSAGVESGNDFIRNTVLDKKLPREKLVQGFKGMREAGLQTEAYLMVGSPGETLETVRETVYLLDEIQPTYAQVTIAAPLPQTYLYERLSEQGLIQDPHWQAIGGYGEQSAFKLEHLSKEQVKDLQKALFYTINVREWLRKMGIHSKYSTIFKVLTVKPLNHSLQFLQALRFRMKSAWAV